MPKWIVYSHWSNSVQKNRSRKHQVFQKLNDVKNRPSCEGFSLCMGYIAFAKYSIWAKNSNCLKHLKIDSLFTLE